jgi:hypothetical protein
VVAGIVLTGAMSGVSGFHLQSGVAALRMYKKVRAFPFHWDNLPSEMHDSWAGSGSNKAREEQTMGSAQA